MLLLKLKWRFLWIVLNVFGIISILCTFAVVYNGVFPVSKYEEGDKIDWNDYELMIKDSLRTGFGEHGKGEVLTDENEIKENEELFKTFGMNVIVSDKVSVNRSIPDFRHPDCMHKKYFRDLPQVSIVIIFHNENFSIFKRTLHSLYNRTPRELIAEVILVDDCSTLDFLKQPLVDYIKENFPEFKFEIIRFATRQGLMKARVAGVKAVKSEILFMMEPHCEMTYNWLPPLIEPLLYGERIVTVPIIDNVEYQRLYYYENDEGNKGSRGVFDWDLEYQKLPRLPIEESKALDPFSIPIMTGGIFMIRKEYFLEIGPYDEELLIWGAENIEMSLKIHLCGGQLLEVPCSRIGHLFRNFNIFRKHETGIDFVSFNRKRIVEVWFDEFKDFVYRKNREAYEIEVGDLTKAKQKRESLNCKPMKYFFKEIASDLLKKFPEDTPSFTFGQIQLKDENLCVKAPNEPDQQMMLRNCSGEHFFELTWYRDIRISKSDLCIDHYKVSLEMCHLQGNNQLFFYNDETYQIVNTVRHECLEADVKERALKFSPCDINSKSQKWTWSEFVNKEMLETWEKSGRPFDPETSEFWP